MKRLLLAGTAGLALSVSAIAVLASSAHADQVFADDVIVQGSLCVGFDCVNGESFGFDTIRLKENNTRIAFDDTSASVGFPANDWQLVANDSNSGGRNVFYLLDQTSGLEVFSVEAAAPTHSLYVDDGGRVGLRTNSPVLDLHINTSNTPGLRLEQNSSGGFSAQTWDIAGNEANFFVRDVTSGSRLPFRIRPGAPTSSVDVAADGDVFIGLAASSSNSGDVVIGGGGIKLLDIVSDTASQLRLVGATENRRIVARDADGGATDTQILMRSSDIALTGATDSAANTFATFDTGGVDIGASTDPTVRLLTVQSSVASQVRLVGNTDNRRFVASDTPLGSADTQILLKNDSIVFAGPTDVSDTWATITANGLVTTGNGTCDPGPCDGVFDPAVFTPPSIEEHAASMWENRYLPGVGPTPEGAPINIGQKVTGVLHELEVAHIYIEQLNNRVNQLEARLAERDG